MRLPVLTPEGARFTCQGCGRCCQGWTVPVEQAAADRLRKHDWGGEPFEALDDAEYPYRIRQVNGRCFFLDTTGRCRIHAEIAYEAKPRACRAFPLAVFEMAGRQYARLSYWCPTVAANEGRPLEQQSRWLREVTAGAGQRTAPLTLDGRQPLSGRQFDVIHERLVRWMHRSDLPMRHRLAASAALLDRLRASPDAEPGDVVSRAETDGLVALAREGAAGGDRGAGRRAVTLYLLQDRPPGRWAEVRRLVEVLLFQAGAWPLGSRAVGGRARWRAVRTVAFDLNPDAESTLTRYLASKVESRRYVAGDASVNSGFNLLAVAYAVAELLARLRAASLGRTTCDAEDLRAAVGAADLLVMEHRGLDRDGLNRELTGATLTTPRLTAGVLRYLGHEALP